MANSVIKILFFATQPAKSWSPARSIYIAVSLTCNIFLFFLHFCFKLTIFGLTSLSDIFFFFFFSGAFCFFDPEPRNRASPFLTTKIFANSQIKIKRTPQRLRDKIKTQLPTTLLSERLDRNQIEKNINTETNLTLLVDKLDSRYQPLGQSHNIFVLLFSRYSVKYLDKNNINISSLER